MDGHYIEVRIQDRSVDLCARVIELLEPEHQKGGLVSFLVLTLSGGIEVFVDELDEGKVILAIGATSASPNGLRAAVQGVYDILVSRTDWELRWTSDEAPDHIRTRPGAFRAASSSAAPVPRRPSPWRGSPQFQLHRGKGKCPWL